MTDRETGRNKGFAFITFEDLADDQVEKLVDGGGWEIDGKTVRNNNECISPSFLKLTRITQVEVKLAQPRNARPSHSSGDPSAIGTYTSDTSARSRQTVSSPQVQGLQEPRDMTAMYQEMLGSAAGPNQIMGPMLGMGSMPMGVGMGGMMGGLASAGMNPMMGMGAVPGMNPMMFGGMIGPGIGMQGPIGAFGLSAMNMPAFNNATLPGLWPGNTPDGSGGGMRFGAGPMAMGMGVRPMGGAANGFRGRGSMGGLGPARSMTRGNHNFHPYARGYQ